PSHNSAAPHRIRRRLLALARSAITRPLYRHRDQEAPRVGRRGRGLNRRGCVLGAALPAACAAGFPLTSDPLTSDSLTSYYVYLCALLSLCVLPFVLRRYLANRPSTGPMPGTPAGWSWYQYATDVMSSASGWYFLLGHQPRAWTVTRS